MIILLLVLKAAIISYSLTPLGSFIGEIIITSSEKITNHWSKLLLYLLSYLLSCSRCFSFWFSLILTGDLLVAALSSIVIYLIEKENLNLLKND